MSTSSAESAIAPSPTGSGVGGRTLTSPRQLSGELREGTHGGELAATEWGNPPGSSAG